MTPNPTSAPAPQETALDYVERNWVELWRIINAGGLIQHQLNLAAILKAYAKADRLKLAEEAAQLNVTKGGFLLLWRDVAAWLREKAQ